MTITRNGIRGSLASRSREPEPLDPGADARWTRYVTNLPPIDRSGAFLLSDELPHRDSSQATVFRAVRIANRRAFGPAFDWEVRDYCQGLINGRVEVLLPQGSCYADTFENEIGWRAVLFRHDPDGEWSMDIYYRRQCMNPFRAAARFEGFRIDVSTVTFRPLTPDEERALGGSRYQSITDRRTRILRGGELSRWFLISQRRLTLFRQNAWSMAHGLSEGS